ncbi:MAG: urease accessory protein UreD [Pseudomonadota bacterium]
MFDLPQPSQPRAMQRARGRARVAFRGRRITGLSQAGSGKVMIPACHGAFPEAVFLNTAGGLTGGDSFAFDASIDDGALMLTTQTAERSYASTGADARVDVTLRAGPGATLFWLPQETILFDASALRRRTVIEAAPGARVLALEMLVFGRAAMGERLSSFRLMDRRELHADGLQWLDALALDARLIGKAAGLRDARAIATLLYWGPDAEDIALDLPPGLHASAWGGKCVIRGAFPDLWPLKTALAPVLRQLTGGHLPRVWAV